MARQRADARRLSLAGLLAHTLYLGYRVVEHSASPLSSSFDWCLVAAWLLVAAYLYLSYYHPQAALGLFMLPLVLALVAAAAFADRTPFAAGPASQRVGSDSRHLPAAGHGGGDGRFRRRRDVPGASRPAEAQAAAAARRFGCRAWNGSSGSTAA